MDEPNGAPVGGDSGDSGSESPVSETQFKHTIDTIQLQLKDLAFNTLDGKQKINLMAIRTLGIVYAVTAIGQVVIATTTSHIAFAELSSNLQSQLVLYGVFYGVVMLLSEVAAKAVSIPSSENNRPKQPENEG